MCTCLQWVWCLSSLCEVASVSDLVTVDCIVVAEMTLRLAMLLESTADCNKHEHEHSPGEKSVCAVLFLYCSVHTHIYTILPNCGHNNVVIPVSSV